MTHSVSARLTRLATAPGTSAQATLPNLIVARSTRLEIYDVEQLQACGAGEPPAEPAAASGSTSGARLRLVWESPLSGVIESLAVLPSRSPGVQRDAVVLTFRDAKVRRQLPIIMHLQMT